MKLLSLTLSLSLSLCLSLRAYLIIVISARSYCGALQGPLLPVSAGGEIMSDLVLQRGMCQVTEDGDVFG